MRENIYIKIIAYIIIIIVIIVFNLKILFIINNKFPKVSIFLPIYNKGLYLNRSISSIQNQTIKDIEIIAINDFSTDNSLKILRNLAKKDPRLKIVNNDRNHGLLYSRAMGILNSSGEYVMNLDPDDKFSHEGNLECLYNKAKELNLDLIIFRLKKIYTNKTTPLKNINNIKTRKLSSNNKSNNNSLVKWKIHNLITNKFIKRAIIIKAFNYFKKYIYGNKWNYGEDNIWSLLIKKFSKSKIYFNRHIYIYFKNEYSLMYNSNNELKKKNRIYRLELIQKMYQKDRTNALKKILNFLNNTIIEDIEIKKKFIRLFIYNKILIRKYNKINNI